MRCSIALNAPHAELQGRGYSELVISAVCRNYFAALDMMQLDRIPF